MKNIWIINHYAKSHRGRHYRFAETLTERNYKVKLICASTSFSNFPISFKPKQKKVTKNINGIEFSVIKSRCYSGNGKERIKNMIDFSYRAFMSERNEKHHIPDVVYASSVHPLSWVVGYLLSKKYNSKLIIETRDLWPETLIRMNRITETGIIAKIMYSLEKYIYKRADHLIFTMPGGEKYLKDKNIKFKDVNYINNGVDLKQFNEDFKKYNYQIKKQPNSFNVVYTGSMGIANAIDQILKAAQVLNEKGYKNIYFHFFGDGYKREEYIQYTKINHLTNVYFYGRVGKKYIPSILGQSDLTIATSKNLSIYEYGVSLNKLFDYFAAGKPILSNIPTPFNKVEKYGVGITVKPDSPQALVDGILKFKCMNKKRYNKYCENALETAQLFDFNRLADKLERIINS